MNDTNPIEEVSGSGPTLVAGKQPSKWAIHRRLYDWMIKWAETPHGAIALFLIAFAESSFFPIPPDPLLVALVLGARKKWWWFASICTVGSVLGGFLGYYIGMAMFDVVGEPIVKFYHAEEKMATFKGWYEQYDYWIVFAAAFTPIPYKVVTIASGVFGMLLPGFAIASVLGRGARFFLVASILYFAGPWMREKIEKYFDLASILFVILLVAGFAVIKLIK